MKQVEIIGKESVCKTAEKKQKCNTKVHVTQTENLNALIFLISKYYMRKGPEPELPDMLLWLYLMHMHHQMYGELLVFCKLKHYDLVDPAHISLTFIFSPSSGPPLL